MNAPPIFRIFQVFQDLRTCSLRPHPVPPTLPQSASNHTSFCSSRASYDTLFLVTVLNSCLSHFGVPFEAPNRLKCPQAVFPNLPSKIACPIFGFGMFLVQSRAPSILESERLAPARCILSHFYPFAFFRRLWPKSHQIDIKMHPKINQQFTQTRYLTHRIWDPFSVSIFAQN